MNGRVYIVGAGPGDPELITIKALNILKSADVVLYDRLVPESILTGLKCELIYVGKEIGDAYLQEKINRLLVEKAKEGKTVVRLKGGDPTIFGRGEEECIYVVENGIECEIIPGVTSAIAVPETAKIPVTSRLASPSVSIITATRSNGELITSDYIPKKGTLVILMGIHVIEELYGILLSVRNKDEPVAVIEKGTLKDQRTFLGKLEDLINIVKQNEVKAPAIIVIGDVVLLRNKLQKC
ncbi:uroporphyrin-III C-methyltransferase [Sulfolobus acidocaldarius SUSAZ]|nr:uroporphyrin-III C-methyltransferase [Sulfolobus acidocaldarius SUSAZ]